MTHLLLHHANCPDGFGAAWLMNRHMAGSDVVTVAMNYGDPLPDLTGVAKVVSVDFCPSADQLKHLMEAVEELVVLDHHKTALEYAEGAGLTVFDSVQAFSDGFPVYEPHIAVLDMNRSGIGIVLDWTSPPLFPGFLLNIEDRDLWRFKKPETPAVFAAVTSRPYTTEEWDKLAVMPISDLISEGEAIERYRQNVIAQIVETAYPTLLPDDTEVLMVACPYALGSDVAGELAKISPSKIAAYFVPYGDRIKYGLRSTEDGPDVSEIAARCAPGGGGHPHSAGFEQRA